MGYDTYYSLTIVDLEIIDQEVIDQINAFIDSREDMLYAVGKLQEDRDCGECHWYDHDDDMLAISKAFPGITFLLTGEGEEKDDSWRAYYRNGKYQYCSGHVTYEPYDESKMITPVDSV